MDLYIVDVFAQARYEGNQLAVVVLRETLATETMQRIAAEMNYSETTFLNAEPESDGGYSVRIFTPAKEIAFAGHPILGTAWVIRHYVNNQKLQRLTLNLEIGQVPVTFEDPPEGPETAWFLSPQVQLGPQCSRDLLAPAIGLSPEDIRADAPIQQMTAGISALIVPLHNLDALRRSMLNLDVFAPLAAQGFPPLLYLYCQETRDPANNFAVRFFFDAHGVREDPATGNAAAFFGAYLLRHRLLGNGDLSLRIEQGFDVRRPSQIHLRATKSDGVPRITVGGQVVPTLRGQLI